jgi:hypothetical protein
MLAPTHYNPLAPVPLDVFSGQAWRSSFTEQRESSFIYCSLECRRDLLKSSEIQHFPCPRLYAVDQRNNGRGAQKVEKRKIVSSLVLFLNNWSYLTVLIMKKFSHTCELCTMFAMMPLGNGWKFHVWSLLSVTPLDLIERSTFYPHWSFQFQMRMNSDLTLDYHYYWIFQKGPPVLAIDLDMDLYLLIWCPASAKAQNWAFLNHLQILKVWKRVSIKSNEWLIDFLAYRSRLQLFLSTKAW